MSDTITICFYGSSDHELEVKLADFYQNDIYLIVDSILELQNTNIKIVTGGYGGIMNSIAEKFASKKKDSGKNIEIVGITCDAYDFENPDAKKYNKSNDYSVYNDVIIQSENFTERVQSMIELSDLFIVLPGKQGTLSELLITCESYSFGKYILNGKETKILVHEYWEPILSDVSYFRKFNTDILTFFNSSSFVELIKSYTNNSTKNVAFSQTRNATKADWHERMTELKGNICKVIFGRVYNEKELLQRLNRDNEFPILGLDFGWFHLYQDSGQDGEYHSYSTEKYISLTEKFFANYNSIMLSNFHKEFEYDYLDGNINSDENLNYYTGESIPQYDSNKNKSSFSELRNFFNKQKYGQTLIWKGLKTELDGGDQNDTDVLIFSIFLLLKHRIPRASIQKINQLLSDFLLKASATKSGELFKEKDKDIINQATRAAISQVMARNTSHNIGAHVMNKLIGDLSKVKIDDFTNYKSDVILYDATKTDHEKLLDQISIFNNYVKCRMDYLADISFGTPLMQTNKYAYADLFKELDKVRLLLEHISGLDNFEFEIKFTRNGKEFKKDNQGEGEDDLLVAIPNDILGTQAFYNILENIIRNSAKHAQKPTGIDKNGNSIKKTTVFTVNFIDNVKKVDGYCNDEKCDRTQCNKAHKKEIENSLNEFIVVEVYDNIPVEKLDEKLDLEESDIKEFNDKKTALPKDNKFSSYIDKLVFSQNKKLNEDILQENKLRSYSLGLVEMDASAAYLRKRPVEFINHRSYDIQYDESWSRNTELNAKPEDKTLTPEQREQLKIEKRGSNCRHFLKAFKITEEVTDKDGNKKIENYLGYRFFLHRPAVVLVVTELLKDDKEKKDKLKKEGIWIVTKEEFEKHLKPENGKNDGKVYPHEFVVIDSNVKFDKMKVEIAEKNPEGQETNRTEEIEFLEHYKTSLPIRVLVQSYENLKILFDARPVVESITCNQETKIVTKTVLDAWEKKCWENWDNKSIKLDYNGGFILPKKADKFSSLNDHTFTNGKDSNGIEILFYDDALSTNGQKKLPNFRKDLAYYKACELNFNLTTKLKVGESIYSRVLIIDERIQDNSRKDFSKYFKIKALYEKTGIIVPDYPDINLSATSMDDELINKIKGIIDKYRFNKNDVTGNFERLNPYFDFILLHYSILERMFKSDKHFINDYLKDLGRFNNVVVTSGRGEPDGLPREVRFINLSSAIHALVETRSKYFTNYILHQSRKSSKNQK